MRALSFSRVRYLIEISLLKTVNKKLDRLSHCQDLKKFPKASDPGLLPCGFYDAA